MPTDVTLVPVGPTSCHVGMAPPGVMGSGVQDVLAAAGADGLGVGAVAQLHSDRGDALDLEALEDVVRAVVSAGGGDVEADADREVLDPNVVHPVETATARS